MKSVMLWGGTVLLKVFPVNAKSLSRVIVFALVSCQTCAVFAGRKFVKFNSTGVVLVNCLLITIAVSAPSLERSAANAETLSGFGTVALTLVSPKVDLL